MKNYYLLIICFLSTTLIQAQRPDKRTELKALKIGYLTKQLELTSSEAEVFWPVYNEFDKKMFELRQQKILKSKNLDIENLTDEDALELIDSMKESEKSKFEYENKLIEDLMKILPPKKIILLKKSEIEFGKQVLEQYKQKKKRHANASQRLIKN